MRPHFRFEDLEIWQLGRKLAVRLHQLADELEKKHHYRYAEQLRATGLSVKSKELDALTFAICSSLLALSSSPFALCP